MRQILLIYIFFLGIINGFGQFSWRNDTPVFPDGDIDGHTYSNVGGIPSRDVTIGALAQGSALAWQSSNPRVAGSSASRLLLGVNYTSNNPANAYAAITFTFSEAACGLNFSIYEIDRNGAAAPYNYVDQVEITATTVGGAALPAPTVTPSAYASATGNIITGISDDNTTSPGAATLITYPANECVQTLTITYRSGPNVQTNPTLQLVSIGDMNWNTALPVRLLSFKGEKISGGAELTWQTVEEVNNSHFIIERSRDAQHFEAIGRVVGNGNSTQKQVYYFVDLFEATGYRYYRLKQVDFGGQFEYSKIIAIWFDDNITFRVFPNPVKESFSVQLPDRMELSTADLYDFSGRLVKQFDSVNNFSIVGTNEGLYVLRIVTTDGRVFRQKLKIQ